MQVEFDPEKDAANRRKTAFGADVFGDSALLIVPSLRPIDGEERYEHWAR